MVMKIYC